MPQGGIINSIDNYAELTSINDFSFWTLVENAATFSLSVNVTLGWNMVSAPGAHPTNQNVETWWSHRTGTVWGFNGVQYVAKTVTTPGEGYWMKNTVAETYSYPAIHSRAQSNPCDNRLEYDRGI